VTQARRRAAIVVAVAALAGAGAGIAIGLSEDGRGEPEANAVSSAAAQGSPPPASPASAHPDDKGETPKTPRTEDDPEGLEPGPSGPPPTSEAEKEVAGAARAYIAAIDDRDGDAVCRSFAPGSLDGLKLPVAKGSCADSVNESLGYRSGGGQPVWQSSEATEAISAQVDGRSARVVATIFTKYADVREPTIEDDIVYLERAGGDWLVSKPSATLYRAIGIADVPLEALEPPA
jgi:hypothetical protein